MNERAEVVCLLKHLSENPIPVGSGTASELLSSAGFQVSEATVGRLLRYMDNQGYTERLGFRGRVLTIQGQEYIDALLHRENRQRYSDQLAGLVRSRSKEDLIETLVARRAIEREIARLAALNITPEQVKGMHKIVLDYEMASGDRVAHGDVAFHQVLADAAGNRVLRAALDLIRQDAQLSPVLGFIREQVHSRIFADHKKIFEAVAAKDSLAAEQAMVEHIENLIKDVEKYWTRVNGTE
jgi:GntR family L-lactate dehydrogenase operon transcriptional regulator